MTNSPPAAGFLIRSSLRQAPSPPTGPATPTKAPQKYSEEEEVFVHLSADSRQDPDGPRDPKALRPTESARRKEEEEAGPKDDPKDKGFRDDAKPDASRLPPQTVALDAYERCKDLLRSFSDRELGTGGGGGPREDRGGVRFSQEVLASFLDASERLGRLKRRNHVQCLARGGARPSEERGSGPGQGNPKSKRLVLRDERRRCLKRTRSGDADTEVDSSLASATPMVGDLILDNQGKENKVRLLFFF